MSLARATLTGNSRLLLTGVSRRANPVARTTRAFFGGAGRVAGSAHDYTVKDIDGNAVALSDFKGKALLVVNVASA